MSLIMATLREHMDKDEDLVLLFVRKKGAQKRENNNRQHEEEEDDELRTVLDSGFIPNLPEGISIRGGSNRSSTGVVTSCYGECRDTTEEEALTDNDTSTEGGTEEGRDSSYFMDDQSDEDSAGEDQLSPSSSEDEDDNGEEETEEDSWIARSESRYRGGDQMTRSVYGGITVRRPVSSSYNSEESSTIVQQDVLIVREDEEEESASDMSVSVDSDSDRLADTSVSDGEVELGESDGHIHSLEENPLQSTENGFEEQSEENSSNNSTEEFLVTRIRGITVTRRQEQNEEHLDLQPVLSSSVPSQNDENLEDTGVPEGIALVPLDREPERLATTDRQAETNNPAPSNHRVIERLARMGITVTRRPHFHHHHHHQRIRIQDHQDTDQSGSDSDVETDDDDMPVLIRDLDLMEREE